MLSLSIVTVLLLGATGAAVWARFSTRGLIVSIVVLEVLGLGLLGLPGGAFLEALEPAMQRVGQGPITGDGAWPAAILMSVAWPLALVPAYLAARSVQSSNGLRGLAAFAVLALMCSLVGAVVYIIAT
jgi:hypothetical protein